MNKKEQPLISIIVPVYKVEKYLDRCLKSIVSQTYKNLEIILVDDGSPDACPELCDRWALEDNRIRVIHKKNGGLSSARNIGIDLSEGEYISFVDSDDWISEDYIEYLFDLICRYSVDLAVADYFKANTMKAFPVSFVKENIITGREFLLKILKVNTQENVQYAWGKLYKNFKDTEIRYPEGLIDEDIPTIFYYGEQCNKVAMSSKIIYAYYENKDSILRRQFNRKRFDLLTVWKMIVKFANEKCDDDIAQYALIGFYRANFGLLCNIATENIHVNDETYVREREKELLEVVKEHIKELLRFPMPLSRKIFVIGFTTCYQLSKKVLKYFNLLRKLFCNINF